jgi:Response regulator of the LytR/AlgR family
MLRIGICDDSLSDREQMEKFCEAYLKEVKTEYEYLHFSSGEELLKYCNRKKKESIDILFLDMEMGEIDGLSVRDELKTEDSVKRIIFITNHGESIRMAFGLKVMGFAEKPVSYEQIGKWLEEILKEQQENITIVYEGFQRRECVEIEQIEYIQADRNYSVLYLHGQTENILTPQNMKYWEEKLKGLFFVRVHKSFIVNLQHVVNISKEVKLRDNKIIIPVGRTYRDKARTKYMNYIKDKVRRRV